MSRRMVNSGGDDGGSDVAVGVSTWTSGGGGATSSPSILSDKVARALQVRTDTPAMKAALEALAQVQMTTTATTTGTSDSSTPTSKVPSTMVVVDARSVRQAMEHDAWQQAWQWQQELQELVQAVQSLRQGVTQVAALARTVRQAAQTSAAPTISTNTLALSSSSATSPSMDESLGQASQTSAASNLQTSLSPTSSSTTNEQEEQKVAARLAEAFWQRHLARKRAMAMDLFMERFHVSEQDARLLDHYAFEEFATTTSAAAATDHHHHMVLVDPDQLVNGWAFLQAMERVRTMRLSLAQTVGGVSSGSGWTGGTYLGGVGTDSGWPGSTSTSNEAGLTVGAGAALRMMEHLAQKQERAYERLYHWLQQYLQLLSPAGNTSSIQAAAAAASEEAMMLWEEEAVMQHPFVQRALYTLRHVPAFYQHTVELIAHRRRTEATRRFLLALTAGYGGMAPLEMKAHDAVAYVGDMLAFSFKAFSVEADVAKGLLHYRPEKDGNNAEDDEANQSNQQEDSPQEHKDEEAEGLDQSYRSAGGTEQSLQAQDMLAISMSGLARPLKSRILQVMSTLARRPGDEDAGVGGPDDDGLMLAAHDYWEDEGSLMRTRLQNLYEICGLLLFYASAMDKTVRKLSGSSNQGSSRNRNVATGAQTEDNDEEVKSEEVDEEEKNPLVVCLLECLLEGAQGYEATNRVYVASLPRLSAALGESEAQLGHVLVTLIADARLHSPGFSVQVEAPTACREILSLEWLVESVVHGATCRSLDDVQTLKGTMDVAKRSGLSVVSAEPLYRRLEDQENILIQQVVEVETNQVLQTCGLGGVVQAWRRWTEQKQQSQDVASEDTWVVMASYPGLAAEAVESAVKSFYASLHSPLIPSLEETIRDPILRKRASQQIASNVCQVYEQLCHDLSSPQGGYDHLSFIGHSPEQVKALLTA